MYLQRAQEMHQIPSVVGLNVVGERGHRGAVHAGHENLIDIGICGTAFESGVSPSVAEIVRADRLILAVGEGRGRRAISFALRAVALPAFQLGE